MYEAEIMKRFKSELHDNKEILGNMELLQEKCPIIISKYSKSTSSSILPLSLNSG